jgi:hypothetical protein
MSPRPQRLARGGEALDEQRAVAVIERQCRARRARAIRSIRHEHEAGQQPVGDERCDEKWPPIAEEIGIVVAAREVAARGDELAARHRRFEPAPRRRHHAEETRHERGIDFERGAPRERQRSHRHEVHGRRERPEIERHGGALGDRGEEPALGPGVDGLPGREVPERRSAAGADHAAVGERARAPMRELAQETRHARPAVEPDDPQDAAEPGAREHAEHGQRDEQALQKYEHGQVGHDVDGVAPIVREEARGRADAGDERHDRERDARDAVDGADALSDRRGTGGGHGSEPAAHQLVTRKRRSPRAELGGDPRVAVRDLGRVPVTIVE